MVALATQEGPSLRAQLRQNSSIPVTIAMDASLHELGLSLRVVNALENQDEHPDCNGKVHQVHQVGQLLNLTDADILAIANLGEKTLQEILHCLARRGLIRAGETAPPLRLDERLQLAKDKRQQHLRQAIAYR